MHASKADTGLYTKARQIPVIDQDSRHFPEQADTPEKVRQIAEAQDGQACQRRDRMQHKQYPVLSKLPSFF
jgi:hypothetical protein